MYPRFDFPVALFKESIKSFFLITGLKSIFGEVPSVFPRLMVIARSCFGGMPQAICQRIERWKSTADSEVESYPSCTYCQGQWKDPSCLVNVLSAQGHSAIVDLFFDWACPFLKR